MALGMDWKIRIEQVRAHLYSIDWLGETVGIRRIQSSCKVQAQHHSDTSFYHQVWRTPLPESKAASAESVSQVGDASAPGEMQSTAIKPGQHLARWLG
jgi:hypothetical protein